MNSSFSPRGDERSDDVREPPLPARGDDVREPPLPSNNGAKDDLPGEEDEIDPDDGGGRAPRRLAAGRQDPHTPPDEIPENERTGDEPHPRS